MNDWQISSYCTASNCVQFRRASNCTASNCVEVDTTVDPGHVWVRNSRSPQLNIAFTVDEWRAFLAGAKNGEFDV